jgi:small subunit ribosomal protein S20
MVDSPGPIEGESEMPKSRTVLKRQRQTERQRLRNKAVRSELRTRERRVRAVSDPAAAGAELKELQKRLDQAAAKGAIHPNKAARKKSRLAKLSRSS